MVRSYSRRSYRSRDEIGREYARQHVEDYHRLVKELGGSVEDVKQYLFSLPRPKLHRLFDAYEAKHGAQKRDYLQNTIQKWRTGKRRMSGTVAERLFSILPSQMPPEAKYQLIENLWNHVGPKSKKTLRVGLDASLEQALAAISSHMEEVVTHFRIPDELERRFNWLAAGDSHAKQDLLNYLRSKEKALVVEGARIQLPVILDHLRSVAGQYTHRVAPVFKIGNHELELLIDKNASGVVVVEPAVPFNRAANVATAQKSNLSWVWWAIAGLVAFVFLVGTKTPKTSYQPSTYTPTYQPTARPTYQPSTAPPTIRAEPLQPSARPAVAAAPPPPSAAADGLANHGRGRVTCDVQWSQSHMPEASYPNFIRDCMSRYQ